MGLGWVENGVKGKRTRRSVNIVLFITSGFFITITTITMDSITNTNSPPTLTSVPSEIVDMILSELDRPTLASSVRVSTAWLSICTPHL